MNKRLLLWIGIALTVVTILTVTLWLVFTMQPRPGINTTQPSLTPATNDRSVSIVGFDKPVLVPRSFGANFTNSFGAPSGAGSLENGTIRISIRPDSANIDENQEVIRTGVPIKDEARGIDATRLYDLVDQERQIYRDVFSSQVGQVKYFQRVKKDNLVYQYPFIITQKRDNSARGIYFSVVFQKTDITNEEKNNQLLQADQILLSQFQ